MTDTDLATIDPAGDLASVLIQGDLSKLTQEQKVNYYLRVCESLKLNPYTKPFGYIQFKDGALQLYTKKDATDQLRQRFTVSIVSMDSQRKDDMLVVTVSAKLPNGRTDFAIGAVSTKGLFGTELANALMRAETKAKRRVTLSICGLGLTDESEVDSIAGAITVEADVEAPRSVPIRERDVDDADIIRSADDPLWQRWGALLGEAQQLAVKDLPKLRLPIGRPALIEQGMWLSEQVSGRKQQLAAEEAARAEGKAEPPPTAWQRNRQLQEQAYALGLRLRDLPSNASEAEVDKQNKVIEEWLAARPQMPL